MQRTFNGDRRTWPLGEFQGIHLYPRRRFLRSRPILETTRKRTISGITGGQYVRIKTAVLGNGKRQCHVNDVAGLVDAVRNHQPARATRWVL